MNLAVLGRSKNFGGLITNGKHMVDNHDCAREREAVLGEEKLFSKEVGSGNGNVPSDQFTLGRGSPANGSRGPSGKNDMVLGEQVAGLAGPDGGRENPFSMSRGGRDHGG